MSKIQEHNVFNYPTFANESLGSIYVKELSYVQIIYQRTKCSMFSLFGATESEVWIGNFNAKARKTTEHNLHKIWHSGVSSFCLNCLVRQKTEHVGTKESKVWIDNFHVQCFQHTFSTKPDFPHQIQEKEHTPVVCY